MKSIVKIDAGICGFYAKVIVASEDNRNVTFDIVSGCDKIKTLATLLKEEGSIDAYEEVNPSHDSVILSTAHTLIRGCCAACAVPIGIFKAMQVAGGLALPKDISIKMEPILKKA